MRRDVETLTRAQASVVGGLAGFVGEPAIYAFGDHVAVKSAPVTIPTAVSAR